MTNFNHKYKRFQRKAKTLLLLLMLTAFKIGYTQNAPVDISVNWPNWSSENRVEVYNPGGNLLATIDNGYDGASNNSYATTLNLNCIPTGNNYYLIIYDTYNDGWNGAANVSVTAGGTTVLTNSGASANPTGITLYFNVSGNCVGTCTSTVASFPYTESFETDLGLWTQDTADGFDWSRNSGDTASFGTGPDIANGGNFYLYTEASLNFLNTSNLKSPCFDLSSATTAQFSFYYHMYGANMGTLNVDLSTNSGLTFPINLWSQTGQAQTSHSEAWTLVTLDLSAYVGQIVNIRFSGTTGSNYRSDLAIDDVTLTAGITSQPEINVLGNGLSIVNGDTTPSTTDDTDYGTVNVNLGANTKTYTIQNQGTMPLTLTGGIPYVSISGINASDFTLSSTPSSPILAGNSTSFSITFDPSSNGIRTAIVTVPNDDSNENPYAFHIQGRGFAPLTEGPGGVTTNLELWLKANDGAGVTHNSPLSTWFDQANSNNATVPNAGQEPTYRDHPNYNVNFNAVVDFENDYNTASIDYTYADTTRDIMAGTAGYFSDDIYIVVIPDLITSSATPSMDIFCADSDTTTQAADGTGIGLGAYSVRFDNEVLSYAHGTSPGSATPVNSRGYGVAQTDTSVSYDTVGIINGRHDNDSNPTAYELLYNNKNIVDVEVGLPQFATVTNANYWLGRSEGYKGSLDGRIVEIITYSSRNEDALERDRIESYLAIKYGITLGVNGISKNYVASNGSVIWDVSANSGYNYDIAGIGRDDNSDLHQKQSKSANSTAMVAFSLKNTELTNNLNTNTFATSNEFLIWGHDGQNTNASSSTITVNLGPAIITTVTDIMNRKWKITETAGDDIGKVEISVFETDLSGLPPLEANDAYVMLISDDANFTTGIKTVFLDPTTFNGLATREGTFDFDGTKYFTFGVAHEEVRTRHLGFDGVDNFTLIGDKIDLAGAFTASAWVKPNGSNTLNNNKTIVAKNNGVTGYKFYLTSSNLLAFSVGTLAADNIESNTVLPNNVWHHVAVIYNGVSASLFIDGVLDNTKTLDAPTSNSAAFAIGAIYVDKTNITDYFKGDLDEISVWDDALTLDQLRYIMNQGLEQASTVVNGVVVPNSVTKNEIASVNWNMLLAYYNMNSFIGTDLNDVSGNGNRGSLTDPVTFTLEYQSAPLPYTTKAHGNWNDTTIWTNGSEQYIPGSASIVDPTITVDWNIVKTAHNLTLDNTVLPTTNSDNRKVLGLFVDANTLTLNGDTATGLGNGLTVTHYLSLDGKIDLEGESQLIQTLGSDFNPASSGTLERDQQGTKDLYTYNYWSSPVGISNTSSNNNSYTIPQIFKDGTNSAAPLNINFISNSYNGTSGSPIGIADFWIWKYANLATNYYNWQHVRSTGSILSGEGFTMKGIANTGENVLLEQNYVLEGKPNNAEITLPIDPGKDYLVGNPYASALDANQFIMDNPTTTGALYYWEHWGGGTHNTSGYQGGYATYNLSGAIPAMLYNYSTGGSTSGGAPIKLPGRNIPVAQGFFVTGAATGNISFNNNQRTFEKEGSNSTFFRNLNNITVNNPPNVTDNRLKIRLGYQSVNQTFSRQLLVTVDPHATPQVDFGFDAEYNENQSIDMYWMIDSEKFLIQGTNSINENTVLPLGLKTATNGINTIKIDQLENVPDNLDIYIFDAVTNAYHNIRNSDFTVALTAGEYLDRFALHFNTGNLLSTEDFNTEASGIAFYFANNNETIVVHNPKLIALKSVELLNILGQPILTINDIKTQEFSEFKSHNLSSGHYILEIKSDIGKLSKKVLVE